MFIFLSIDSFVNFPQAIFFSAINWQIKNMLHCISRVYRHTYIHAYVCVRFLGNCVTFFCFDGTIVLIEDIYMLENISLPKMKFVLGSFQLTFSIDQTV